MLSSCQNGDKNRFSMCVFTVMLKIVNYGLVIVIRFRHGLIIRENETVNSYFMPRPQTFKFLYNFKAIRYNVNLMNKNQSEPKHFGAFI